jgi:hypothetical protein
MALLQNIQYPNGTETNYHKINYVTLNDQEVTCELKSYTSIDYRKVNKSADSSYYHFTITVEEEESMGIRALCYTKIKSLPEWEDAEDC